jgi:Uma2 family endonuclease
MVTYLKPFRTEDSIAPTWVPNAVSELIDYPDDNGEPLSDNTRQLAWIILLKNNLDALFASNPLVFVAGDLLWYPTEGNNKRSAAPDIMVVFGRPKHHRRSYKQWEEEGIGPQVVFEILSHCNTAKEMAKKLMFYDEHGVEEYYIYDPENNTFRVWLRGEVHLELVPSVADWLSPRLGIKFDLSGDEMTILGPDDRLFSTYPEVRQQFQDTSQQLEDTSQQLEAERSRSQALANKLRELGIDPSTLTELG